MPHPIPTADQPPIDRLRQIMHLLRAPGGCPWDAEQTHESLAPHLIEEAYEVAAAIKTGNPDELVDELGDILLQPVFHAELASETGAFDFDDIASAICEKLIRRHPHVFGDAVVDDPDAVITQWDKIKATEKSGGLHPVQSPTVQGTILKNANEGLPALMAAQKIQKKVAKVGFDWPELNPVMDKIREETDEVAEALASGDADAIAEEIGDLLFAVVNIARKTGNQAELLLDAANRKFVDRFQKIENSLAENGVPLEEATLEQMDEAWEAAK
ncbi:MAG: nucleoside triphosphate pyrophosphohydrolase [Verrucomicrobiales bacterium]|nr:nucleoside triphosphate pyrophosphohydrolase [Verrucomicrobiales bacterium]